MSVSRESWLSGMTLFSQAPLFLFQNRISTVLLPTAVFAAEAGPHGIELIQGSFYQWQIVAEDTRLKVPRGTPFHAYAGTRQVG